MYSFIFSFIKPSRNSRENLETFVWKIYSAIPRLTANLCSSNLIQQKRSAGYLWDILRCPSPLMGPHSLSSTTCFIGVTELSVLIVIEWFNTAAFDGKRKQDWCGKAFAEVQCSYQCSDCGMWKNVLMFSCWEQRKKPIPKFCVASRSLVRKNQDLAFGLRILKTLA